MKIKGYFSVFGNQDRAGEIVDEGAFTEWIAKNPTKQLPVYWEHDHQWGSKKKPIGVTTLIKQTKLGAYFEARLSDTQKALDVGTLIKDRAVAQASFAYEVLDQYEENGIWHLSKLEPREVTVAGIHAANPMAYVEPMEEPNNE